MTEKQPSAEAMEAAREAYAFIRDGGTGNMTSLYRHIAAALDAFAARSRERWRVVVGWENHYEVSDLGNLRGCDGAIVGQWPNHDGYMLCRLAQPRKQVRVHRLVAGAFVPNPDDRPYVNHLDCNPAHNAASNLEWSTQKENLAHSARLGRMQKDYWKGKKSPMATLRDETVIELRARYSLGGTSYATLATEFGISKTCAMRAINGSTYSHIPLPEPPSCP